MKSWTLAEPTTVRRHTRSLVIVLALTLAACSGERDARDIRGSGGSEPVVPWLFVTPNRTLWVVDATVPGEGAWTATAFRTDGAIFGRLRVPTESTPVAFADDRIVLRTNDDDGVVAFRVHRIVPYR